MFRVAIGNAKNQASTPATTAKIHLASDSDASVARPAYNAAVRRPIARANSHPIHASAIASLTHLVRWSARAAVICQSRTCCVATIDASTVELFGTVAPDDDERPAAARARFTRHEHEVLVLDIVRVVRAVYEATQHAARDQARAAVSRA